LGGTRRATDEVPTSGPKKERRKRHRSYEGAKKSTPMRIVIKHMPTYERDDALQRIRTDLATET